MKYEKLKLFEERVRSGVCFTQKEWFDFCNEDSKKRTSLIVKAKEQASKETAEKIFAKIFEDFSIDCGTFSLNMARKRYMNAQVEQTNLALRRRFLQVAKQFGVEIKE